jgi:hypothetical protein
MANQDQGKYNWGTVKGGVTVLSRTFRFNIDLTGYTGKIQFRERPGSEVVINLETGNGLTINGTDVVVNSFTAPTTNTQKEYLYDFKLTAPNGDVSIYIEGVLIVKPEITR